MVCQCVLVIYISYDTKAIALDAIEKFEKNSLGVIMMSKDGRATKTGKVFLDIKSDQFKKHIASVIENYLILDENKLTNYGDLKKIPDVNTLYRKNHELKDFGENFFDFAADKNMRIHFENHLKTLLRLITKDEMIEDITVRNFKVERYIPKSKKEFSIAVTYNISTEYYLKELGQWKEGRGGIKVVLDGILDENLSSTLNPFGIRPTAFSVTYPKKRKKGF